MEAVLQDLRLACRQLARRPLFAAVAVLTLAVGMGLNAVVFTAVNALFLKGNAMSSVEGAVWISTTGPRGSTTDVSLPVAGRTGHRVHRWLGMIGRIRPGVSLAEADARLAGAATALAREWPARDSCC